MQLILRIVTNSYRIQWHSLNAEKVKHVKGRLLDHTMFYSILSLFRIGTSLKGKILIPEGANSFRSEQFLTVCKLTFTTLGDHP